MVSFPVTEGTAPFKISSIEEPCFTYYKIIGDLSCGTPPCIIMHGGPGVGHEYLLPLGALWSEHGIPVVFYDQIGCAGSTHLPQTAGDYSFWQESLFLSELDNLIDYLNIRSGTGFHLLGHSFGGMMAAAYATSRPAGLQKLVLASGLASRELSAKSLEIRRKSMPAEIQRVFDRADETDDFSSPEFVSALMIFWNNFFYRGKPFPPEELMPALKHKMEDGTAGDTCNGPSPILSKRAGSFLEWTCISRLPNIAAPTLVYNGEYDTSHDISQVPFFECIPRVRWITFANAAHMCHMEPGGMREKVLKTVGEFLKS